MSATILLCEPALPFDDVAFPLLLTGRNNCVVLFWEVHAQVLRRGEQLIRHLIAGKRLPVPHSAPHRILHLGIGFSADATSTIQQLARRIGWACPQRQPDLVAQKDVRDCTIAAICYQREAVQTDTRYTPNPLVHERLVHAEVSREVSAFAVEQAVGCVFEKYGLGRLLEMKAGEYRCVLQ